jgi:hypothetical protein
MKKAALRIVAVMLCSLVLAGWSSIVESGCEARPSLF